MRLCALHHMNHGLNFVRRNSKTTRARHRHLSSEQSDDLAQLPDVVRDARFHGRGDPESLVNPAEVVVHEVERDGRFEVLDLLREGVREPREPPHAHPHREVLELDVRRGDVPLVWVASYYPPLGRDETGWAVTTLSLGARSVDLDEL